MVSNVSIKRPIMLAFVHPDNERFSFACVENEAESVRGKLDSLIKPERRKAGQGRSSGPVSQFDAYANMVRAAEGMLAGFHPQTIDEAYGQILNTQLPVANVMLSLGYFKSHPEADHQRGTHAAHDHSTEGQIAQDPFMSEAYDFGSDQLDLAKATAKKIRSGPANVIDQTFKAGGLANPLSNESKFARAVAKLDQSIDARIEQIDGFLSAGDQVKDEAKPYYEAAKMILADAKLHLGDWRENLIGPPQQTTERHR